MYIYLYGCVCVAVEQTEQKVSVNVLCLLPAYWRHSSGTQSRAYLKCLRKTLGWRGGCNVPCFLNSCAGISEFGMKSFMPLFIRVREDKEAEKV